MASTEDDVYFFKDTKETEDEPEWKRGRQIKCTNEESEYRNVHFRSVDVTKKFKQHLRCTGCDKDMSKVILSGKKVTHHPNLRVLFCDDCKLYYECDEFSMDEDGTDKYCRWCGAGCTLFCCSTCVYGFCKKCLRKHFGVETVKKIQRNENWLCLFCNPQPLWFLRGICYAAKMESKKRMRGAKKAPKKSKKETEVKKKKDPLPLSPSKEETTGPSVTDDNANEGKRESPEPRRPSSRASSAETVIFENQDVIPSTFGDSNTVNNNNDNNRTDVSNKSTDLVSNKSNNSNNDITVASGCNGVDTNRKRKRPGKESDREKKTFKKSRRANLKNIIRDSSESGIENSNDGMTDFPVVYNDAKKDLEGVYKITQMTSNLCDKVIEKRLGRIKLIHSYQSFCKEYSKIEQIVDCLQNHFTQILTVANHVKGKLKEAEDK